MEEDVSMSVGDKHRGKEVKLNFFYPIPFRRVWLVTVIDSLIDTLTIKDNGNRKTRKKKPWADGTIKIDKEEGS